MEYTLLLVEWNAEKPRFSSRLHLCDETKVESDAAHCSSEQNRQNQQKCQKPMKLQAFTFTTVVTTVVKLVEILSNSS